MEKNHGYIIELRGRAHVAQVAHVLNILIFLNIHTHVAHVIHGLIRLSILSMFTEHRARLLNRLARISNLHNH